MSGSHPISIAPMMEWTDRHYRRMMRLLTRRTLLYTEMVVDTTLLHQRQRLAVWLGHCEEERPLVVQLGGNDPTQLAEAAGMCEEFGGFCEINLNCGCPSPRVSQRRFGASLMLEPDRVREIVHAMTRRATATPVTVKCRVGADERDSYQELLEFVEAVRSGGAKTLVVHARKCLLNGLSPAQNRNVPPLQYEVVHRLVRDFPDMSIVLNGGVQDLEQARAQMAKEGQWGPPVHGVMIGRMAYNTPWEFRGVDSAFFGATDPGLSRREVVEQYVDYASDLLGRYGGLPMSEVPVFGVSMGTLVKPLHNLFAKEPGSRQFRRRLSELWSGSKGSIDFEEMVSQALEETLSPDVLDAAPCP